MKKIGLVLSGGGVRALAHAGLLKALDEKGLRPSIIAGTSGGAIIGGLYACGIKPDDMLPFFKQTPLFKWSMLTFKKLGLLDSAKYAKFFQPLLASSALPPYFSPVKIGDSLYCDGGLLNNFPTEPLKGQCEVMMGSFINPLETITEKELGNSYQFMQRIYNITMDGNYNRKFKKCDYLFLHNLSNIGVLETKMLDRAFEYGYEITMKQLTNYDRNI